MSRSKEGGKRGAGVRSSRAPRDRDGELRRFEPVSDDLVLAAVERAERHRERKGEGVMMGDIAEHLGSFMARGRRGGCVRRSRRSSLPGCSCVRVGTGS